MKKLLPLFAFLTLASAVHAQTLTGITHIPNPATTNDQVKIILDTDFPYNCISDSFNVVVSGNQVQIYMYQCMGMLQIICSKTDTVDIGQLPQGTYITYVFISTSQANPNCSMYSPPTPQNQPYTFVVNQATSTGHTSGLSKAFEIYPNPSGQATYFRFPVGNTFTQLVITDISGKEAGRYPVAGVSEFILPEGQLPKGMYFVQGEGHEGPSIPQKLLIAQ